MAEDGSSRSSTAKKATAKRTTAKKAPAKKAAAKRAGSKNAGAKKAAPREAAPQAPKKVPAMEVARSAARQLAELTGRTPECVIGIERTDDGWVVELEVVESRRIPDSTDILATYRVETDRDGDLLGYRRARRYVRGKGGDGDGAGR